MLLVMSAVNIPAKEITIIFAIDWALWVAKKRIDLKKIEYFYSRDRIRTSVNILGDGIGAGVVDYLVRDELGPIELEEGENINKPTHARTASELSAERRLHSRDDFNEVSKL
jgi:hypothetical protein